MDFLAPMILLWTKTRLQATVGKPEMQIETHIHTFMGFPAKNLFYFFKNKLKGMDQDGPSITYLTLGSFLKLCVPA